MALFETVLDDLEAESRALMSILQQLDSSQAATPTAALPWTIKDQVAHLAFFDDQQRLAIVDESVFVASARHAMTMSVSLVDVAQATYVDEEWEDVVEWFDTSRADLLHTFRTADPRARLEWFGPSMSVTSAATARLMETWAHGVDVTDALGRQPSATDRLRHLVHLAHRARPFAYQSHGLDLPDTSLRFELTSPRGELWSEGDEDTTSVVMGSALELCLVATQRRHVLDTELVCSDAVAAEWLGIAQAFAGPPGRGREPGCKR